MLMMRFALERHGDVTATPQMASLHQPVLFDPSGTQNPGGLSVRPAALTGYSGSYQLVYGGLWLCHDDSTNWFTGGYYKILQAIMGIAMITNHPSKGGHQHLALRSWRTASSIATKGKQQSTGHEQKSSGSFTTTASTAKHNNTYSSKTKTNHNQKHNTTSAWTRRLRAFAESRHRNLQASLQDEAGPLEMVHPSATRLQLQVHQGGRARVAPELMAGLGGPACCL